MQNIYGVLDNNNCYIDVSNSEKGAKNYATRHGYNKVYLISFNCGYHVKLVAVKNGNKWESK